MSGLHVEEKHAICSSLTLINVLEANDLAISLHGHIICLGHTLSPLLSMIILSKKNWCCIISLELI